MIQELQVHGYRSLRNVKWRPGRLNVVIGPNGSGKSNLLRALALLRDSARGKLASEILNQGGMTPLLWDGQTQELAWTLQTSRSEVGQSSDRRILEYELRLRQLGKSSAYRVELEKLQEYEVEENNTLGDYGTHLERHEQALSYTVGEPGQPPHRTSGERGSIPDNQTLLFALGPFAGQTVLTFRSYLASWGIFHDIYVGQDAPIRQAAVTRLEHQVAASGQNLVPVLHTLYTSHREFKDNVDAAMRAAFGEDFEELSFPPAADQRVQLRLQWRSLRSAQSAADLSDGTLRFLLLLAILANPEPSGLIAIDEPEAGLHPGMLPILAELAAEAAERSQVILTTHSPQMLDAFGDHIPTTTVARWVDGQTSLSVVDGGELARWLKEYSLGALFRSEELEGME